MLEKYGPINDLSKELLDKIPEFIYGKEYDFRLLTGIEDIADKNTKKFGALKTIVLHDFIKDPFTGKRVEIGVPIEFNDHGRPTRWQKFYVVPEGDNQFNNGNFTLVGGKLEHELILSYLFLSNDNGTNPYRDKGRDAIFELIDQDAETLTLAAEVDSLDKALSAHRNMDRDDLIEFASGMNWDLTKETKVLQAKSKLYAKANPDDFLARLGSPEKNRHGKLKKAFDKGIINYQPDGGDGLPRVVWGYNGAVLAKLQKEDGNPVEAMAKWISVSGNGEAMFKAILKQLSVEPKAATV
jgi:hypothetical protein